MRILHAARRRAVSLAILALATLATPQTGHAQLLKKLKDATKKSATDAAADKVLGPDSAKTAPASGAPSPDAAAPAGRSSTQLEITTGRIDVMLAALEPLATERERAAKADQAWRAYEKARDDWTRCYNTSITAANAATLVQQSDEAAMEKANQRMQKAAAEMQTASADTVRMAAAQAELEEAGYAFMAAQYPSVARKCGASPGQRPDFGARTYRSQEAVVQRIAREGGMNSYQLGLMRERVAAWLLSDGQLTGNYAGVKLSDAEAQALASRRAQLARFTPLFRNGILEWTHWSDLGSW
jgi:hypothetical protein